MYLPYYKEIFKVYECRWLMSLIRRTSSLKDGICFRDEYPGRAVAAADRVHTVDGAWSHPHGWARSLHVPLRRIRLWNRALWAALLRAALRAPKQQGSGIQILLIIWVVVAQWCRYWVGGPRHPEFGSGHVCVFPRKIQCCYGVGSVFWRPVDLKSASQ